MKHINSNFSGTIFNVPFLSDGKPLLNSVDQFPVSDMSLYKRDGWPMSDIGILERYSRDSNVSQAEIDAIARRLEYVRSEPSNKKSDEQLLRDLRPAWVQTASEFKDFERLMYQTMSADVETSGGSSDEKDSSAAVESAVENAPTHSVE